MTREEQARRAAELGVAYPKWVQSYSGEDFDRTSALAARLTDEDRAAGRLAPAVGYSLERARDAEAIVKTAQGY